MRWTPALHGNQADGEQHRHPFPLHTFPYLYKTALQRMAELVCRYRRMRLERACAAPVRKEKTLIFLG
jgi:hypothetical protein